MAFDRAICDERSESFAMLFRACFTQQAIVQGILPDEYVFGDVLMVETVRLEPRYRGVGLRFIRPEKPCTISRKQSRAEYAKTVRLEWT
jgi:hypothetical protein